MCPINMNAERERELLNKQLTTSATDAKNQKGSSKTARRMAKENILYMFIQIEQKGLAT